MFVFIPDAKDIFALPLEFLPGGAYKNQRYLPLRQLQQTNAVTVLRASFKATVSF
jgi:hypothetical protein